ncbi:hypothetical protein ACWGH8_12555 [Nonomuraea muscovyensis]|uniref:Uncharacterized protein n=1 Tax=Nonomuraea muscovyensis TaxID=1124761 RepID=A0A7X0C8Y5_9ACTN|nr:hypothetical protein [Nonomuraea muscovyensis]MBB6350497.1 hypothetical protein [Nonomuraea muscovyensis]MDF2710005.1 hypothetical protein [Nonomuraea muscovyensis]
MGIWFFVMLAVGLVIVTGMGVTLMGMVLKQVREGELYMRAR